MSPLFFKRGYQVVEGEKKSVLVEIDVVGGAEPHLSLSVGVGYLWAGIRLTQAEAVGIRNGISEWLEKLAEIPTL